MQYCYRVLLDKQHDCPEEGTMPEDQVQQRTRELHAVLDERKAFFSDLAHNLKAPVVAIHGFTDSRI